MNYSPFIYALDETNVGVTGRGAPYWINLKNSLAALRCTRC